MKRALLIIAVALGMFGVAAVATARALAVLTARYVAVVLAG